MRDESDYISDGGLIGGLVFVLVVAAIIIAGLCGCRSRHMAEPRVTPIAIIRGDSFTRLDK